MARKAKEPAPMTDDQLPAEVAQVLTQEQNTIGILQSAHSEERDLVNQLLGQAQLADAFGKFSQTVWASKLAYVKENKLYKAIAGQKTPNGLELTGTWEDFCALLGVSDEKANQDIANLKAFGEEALESMSRMGIGYRELRQFRRLPEDEKTALIEVAKAGDKNALVEFAETIFEKHAKEKSELAKKVEELTADSESKELVIADKDKKINEQAKKLTRLKKLSPDDVANEYRVEISKLENEIEEQIRVNFRNALHELSEYANDNGLEGDHQTFINAQANMINKALVDVAAELGITLEATAAVEWE